ncbi:MAG TPA: nuclear transport factor 2 family protein [Acidimicrobiales bacterium]|jgi:limonene-1,2-epoxide hydrolase
MDPIGVVQDMWSAVYARDWPRLQGFFTEDSIYYDVPTGPTTAARGPEGIIARLRLGLDELAGYEHRPGSIAMAGEVVMLEHAETWHWATGETVTLPFVTVHRVVGEKVLLWKDYWDYETLRRGAPPDWEERLLAADVSGWIYDATGV